MFVNGVPFFNTYSRGIRFITSRQQDPKTDLTMQSIKLIKDYYVKRGFNIVELRSDQQFEPSRAALTDMQIDLNASVSKNVPEIECHNRIMKERIWSVYTYLIRVYGCFPGVLIRNLVYSVTFWIDSFSAKDDVSAMLIL